MVNIAYSDVGGKTMLSKCSIKYIINWLKGYINSWLIKKILFKIKT